MTHLSAAPIVQAVKHFKKERKKDCLWAVGKEEKRETRSASEEEKSEGDTTDPGKDGQPREGREISGRCFSSSLCTFVLHGRWRRSRWVRITPTPSLAFLGSWKEIPCALAIAAVCTLTFLSLMQSDEKDGMTEHREKMCVHVKFPLF